MSRRPTPAQLVRTPGASTLASTPTTLDFREGMLGGLYAPQNNLAPNPGFQLPMQYGTSLAQPFQIPLQNALAAPHFAPQPLEAAPNPALMHLLAAQQQGVGSELQAELAQAHMLAQMQQMASQKPAKREKSTKKGRSKPKTVDVGAEIQRCIQRRNREGVYT